MGRAPCCDKANVKRGPWSPEEDSKLKAYIEKHGTGGNWINLPQKVGLKRCGKSCRLRWLNYLRPNIKHGGFSQEEDNIICSLYISIGSRWSIIAAQMPGRTDNDIKNYWNSKLKKKLFAKLNIQPNLRLSKQAEMVELKRDLHWEADSTTSIHGTYFPHQHNTTMNMNSCYAHSGPGIFSTCTQGSTFPTSQADTFRELNLEEAFFYQETPLPDHNSYAVRVGATSSNNINVIGTSYYKDVSQLPQSAVETSPQVSYGIAPVSMCMENQRKEESATLHQIDNLAVLSPSSSMGGGSVDENCESSMYAFNAHDKDIHSYEGCEFSKDFNDLLYHTRDSHSSPVPLDSFGWLGDTNSCPRSCSSIYAEDL